MVDMGQTLDELLAEARQTVPGCAVSVALPLRQLCWRRGLAGQWRGGGLQPFSCFSLLRNQLQFKSMETVSGDIHHCIQEVSGGVSLVSTMLVNQEGLILL